MGTRVVHLFHRHKGKERLLQVGKVRDPACNLSAYFSLPDFLPHLRGSDKLVLIQSTNLVILIWSVWFGGLWVGVLILLCSHRTDMATCSGKVSC